MTTDDRRSDQEEREASSSPSVAPDEAIVRQKQQELLAVAPKVAPADPAAPTAQVSAVFLSASFSGPMPPPRMLAQYDKVVPGMAGRVLVLAEDEAKSRRNREIDDVHLQHRMITTEQLGVIAALITTLAAFATVAYLASTGSPTGAVTLGVAVIVALASAFIYGTKRSAPQQQPPRPEEWSGPGAPR